MGAVLDLASWVLLLGGGFFLVVGGIGLLRLPDFYSRLHAAGITDTLGAGLVVLGLLLQAGSWLVAVKLVLILGFMLFTSPTATHALAKAALHGRLEPVLSPGRPGRKHPSKPS